MAAVEARYWHRLQDGRIQCDLCPRYCKLRDGQRGLCFVRARDGEQLVLTTYGRSSGFCIDPIEKKPLNHFYPGSSVLSFGTAGCNLACRFCQNWDISKARQVEVLATAASPRAIAEVAAAEGCRGVAFTYNDPIIFHEYAVDTARVCRELGLSTVAVSAGYVCPGPRSEFYFHMDAANIDLKSFSDDFYRRFCAGRLQPVLDTLEYVAHETETWLEVTTLLIPGLNDSDEEIGELTSWVADHLGADVPLHFSAFHPDFKMRDRPPTPPDTLRRARGIALENGVRHAYTGNVWDPQGQSTICDNCGETVIGRDRYTVTAWRLDEVAACMRCGTPCPGVFDVEPGAWGARCRPLRVVGDDE